MRIEGTNIITKHFDIFDNICILDILMPNGIFVYLEYVNHKLKSKTIWDLSPAVKGMPGEPIQGTYKAHKNVC